MIRILWGFLGKATVLVDLWVQPVDCYCSRVLNQQWPDSLLGFSDSLSIYDPPETIAAKVRLASYLVPSSVLAARMSQAFFRSPIPGSNE